MKPTRRGRPAPVMKLTGAKWALAGWVLDHMPPGYDRYVETHFGSGAVFFSRPPVRRETVNDVDGEVVNLFRVVREPRLRERLIEAAGFTPWSEEELKGCASPYAGGDDGPDPVERARRLLVVAWQGISARRTGPPHFRFTAAGGSTNDHPPSTWRRLPERIRVAGERLAGVQVLRRDAVDVVRANADPRVLLYVDPPYLRSTRSRAYYPHEMTPEDHERLLAALREHPGAAVVSGYDHPLYREGLSGWRRAETPRRSQRNAAARTEILWLNDDAWRGCRASRSTPLFGG